MVCPNPVRLHVTGLMVQPWESVERKSRGVPMVDARSSLAVMFRMIRLKGDHNYE